MSGLCLSLNDDPGLKHLVIGHCLMFVIGLVKRGSTLGVLHFDSILSLKPFFGSLKYRRFSAIVFYLPLHKF